MNREGLLPIKVVLPRPDFDYRVDPSGGGSKDIFCNVTPELRKKFVTAIGEVQAHFADAFQVNPAIPGVAKVSLRSDATAKSHRPGKLFDASGCPIIGYDEPGKMLVGVDNAGLSRLSRTLDKGTTKEIVANISTLDSIVPYSDADTLSGQAPKDIDTAIRNKRPLGIRLFRYPSAAVNAAIDAEARRIATEHKVEQLEELDYGEGLRILAMRGATAQAVRAMRRFVGTQSLTPFPDYKVFRAAAHVVGKITDLRFPPPAPDAEYGLVGLIDSGTDPNNDRLQAYVVRRERWVKAEEDNSHGSFIAGLIANARALNQGNTRFPSVRSRIVDIVAIDKTGIISEYDLITIVEKAVREYRDVKVWNLSLGQNTPCKDGRFSLLGMKLDSISRKYGVLFVIAAGNYEQLPLRGWPPPDLGDDDRICPPADSVRGLTVGSLAYIANSATCVKIDEPSGFGRRGPAPHFYIKPEVSHYGGNCGSNGDCIQNGVVSICGSESLGENIGTSFAAPNVSTLAANVFHELKDESEVSPTLVKGLLVHSAMVRSGRVTPTDVRYRGFGTPGDIGDILNCSRSSATIIFHAEMIDNRFFEKHDFPMPSCLNVPGKGIAADIYMTLAYDPPTDARYGVEYCRSNVTASLGTVDVDPMTGKEKYTPQLTATPKGLTQGREEALVRDGFKWSPLKLYHRPFERGPVGKRWRLHLEILNRFGVRCLKPQKIVLLVTISDPHGKANVYEELESEMQRLAWGAQDLRVSSRWRGRPRN